MKTQSFLLHYARVMLNESRTRRRMAHLPHQVAFSWTLQNWTASARREYIAAKSKGQGDLFA